MYDCGDELHFDCGCDEEFASRPRQRYCGCGQPMGYRDQQCDDCLDIALGEDLNAALDDHRGASDRYVRRMLDTGELVAEWRDNQRHLHDDDCRCMDCCGAYVG